MTYSHSFTEQPDQQSIVVRSRLHGHWQYSSCQMQVCCGHPRGCLHGAPSSGVQPERVSTTNFRAVWAGVVSGRCWMCPKIAYNVLAPSKSSMHHYECVTLCKDISLQRGQFWASSLASCSSKFTEERSPWMVFIQVVRGRRGGRLQLLGGGSKMTWLPSASCNMNECVGFNVPLNT